MKSAYELAMERLSKSDPESSRSLTAAQREKLAGIDRVYQAKIAERDIFLKQHLEEALAKQDGDEAEKIRKQMSSERSRIEEEREAEKERVRNG